MIHDESHKRKLKALARLERNRNGLSINRIMETNARKYEHIEAPMASLKKLPPLRSPHGDYDNDRMPLKKIVLNRRS